MNKSTVLFILFTLITKVSFSTVLVGQNPEYAKRDITFYTYSDPISKSEQELFTLHFDSEGKFISQIDVNKTTFVFCEFGIYRGEFFLEPDITMQPVFPPLREKSFADQKNPFFEPALFWFKFRNENGLNQEILNFEARFNQLTNQYFNQLYFNQSQEVYDSVIYILNQDFPKSNNEVFEVHKNLKLSFMQSEVFRQNPEDGAAILSYIPEEYWEYPAFISYFERMFSNRLSVDVKTEKGNQIQKAIAQSDVGYLTSFIKNKYNLTGNIVQLTTVKMLYDAFHSGQFSQNAILQFLQSNNWETGTSKRIQQVTSNVTKKLNFLRPGTKAPVICLKDIDGHHKCSNDNNDRFKYLIFADAEMVVCREHLKYLTKIQELYQKHLEIILVMRKTDIIEMKMFLDKNHIPGMQLVDETGDFIRNYQIKVFPSCFLLNKNHEVVFENAKAPLDGFEQQFGAFLKQKLFESQRGQSQ